jgi:hypothetical protein
MIKDPLTQPQSSVRFSALFLLAAGFNRRIREDALDSAAFNRRIKSKNASLSRLASVPGMSAAFASLVLGFAQRLDAASAEPLGDRLTLFEDSHLLDVDAPLRAGGFLGPGAIVAELRAFAAIFALSHDSHSLIKKVVVPDSGVHTQRRFNRVIGHGVYTKTTTLGSTSSLHNC